MFDLKSSRSKSCSLLELNLRFNQVFDGEKESGGGGWIRSKFQGIWIVALAIVLS